MGSILLGHTVCLYVSQGICICLLLTDLRLTSMLIFVSSSHASSDMCANFWQALPFAASSCLLFHPSGYGRKSSMTLSHPVALAATLRPRPCLRVHICVIRLFLQPTRTCLSGDVFEEVKWTLFRVCRYRGQCMFAHTQAPAETHVSSLFFGHTDCVVWESNKLRVEGARVWNVQFIYIYVT